MALYQRLKMVCLLIRLTVLSLPLTGEASTTEYWVRPDTVLECPQDTLQHQCVTITDLVSYSTNSSLNRERNITIHFLPGVHTPRVGRNITIHFLPGVHTPGVGRNITIHFLPGVHTPGVGRNITIHFLPGVHTPGVGGRLPGVHTPGVGGRLPGVHTPGVGRNITIHFLPGVHTPGVGGRLPGVHTPGVGGRLPRVHTPGVGGRLPGVHTPGVGGRILIENQNWNTTNLKATVTGEQRGGQKTEIECGLSKVAFVFYHIFLAVFKNVKINNCGYETGLSISGPATTYHIEFTSYLYNKVASVAYVYEVPAQNNVLMDNVALNTSSGFGVLTVQYCHSSNACVASLLTMHIANSLIGHSNIRQPGMGYGSFGGNVLVLGRSNVYIVISNMTISYGNKGPSNPSTYHAKGGMDIFVSDGTITLRLQSSKFVGNEADSGGGLNILHKLINPLRESNTYGTVDIHNCTFLSNRASV